MSAMQLFKEQEERDVRHHKERVTWLTGTKPLYSCGTPVAKSDIAKMLEQSKAILANPHLGYNSAHTTVS